MVRSLICLVTKSLWRTGLRRSFYELYRTTESTRLADGGWLTTVSGWRLARVSFE